MLSNIHQKEAWCKILCKRNSTKFRLSRIKQDSFRLISSQSSRLPLTPMIKSSAYRTYLISLSVCDLQGLANIYLHELDLYVAELSKGFQKPYKSRITAEYSRLSGRMTRVKQKIK